MKYSIILFITIILFHGCSNEHSQKHQNGDYKFEPEIDTLQISIDETKLQMYVRVVSFVKDNHEMMISYNHLLHSFDIFDITKQTFYKTVNLKKDGPNSVLNVGEYCIKNDTIVIKESNFIYVLDMEGQVLKRISLYDSFENLDERKHHFGRGLQLSKDKELCYNSEEKKIYCPIYENIENNGKIVNFLPSIAEIDIDKKSLKIIDIKRPELLQKSYYGDLAKPFISLFLDKILYSFPLLPNIYLLDTKTGNIKEIQVKHINVKGSADDIPFTWKSKTNLNYSRYSKQYFNLKPDLYNKNYYRISQEENKDKGKFKYYLSVFDPEFNLISEGQCDFGNEFYFSGKKGILKFLMLPDEKVNPDVLPLCRMIFEN